MLLLYLHRHMDNCYHFNISKIIFLTLSDARMCVPVYILFFFHWLILSPELRERNSMFNYIR